MKKVFVLVMALAVMVGSSLYAQGNDNRGNERRPRPNTQQQDRKGGNKRGIDLSKLSETQRAEVKAIQQKYDIELSNFSLDIKKQNNIIKAEMRKDSPDKSVIDTAIDEKTNLQAQREKMKFEERLAIQAIIKASKATTSAE